MLGRGEVGASPRPPAGLSTPGGAEDPQPRDRIVAALGRTKTLYAVPGDGLTDLLHDRGVDPVRQAKVARRERASRVLNGRDRDGMLAVMGCNYRGAELRDAANTAMNNGIRCMQLGISAPCTGLPSS